MSRITSFSIQKNQVFGSATQKTRETLPVYYVLPAVQPRGSIVYLATSVSSGELYYSNGIAWVPISSSTSVVLVDQGTGITVNNGAGPTATVLVTDTAVMPGSYTNANLTVNAQGQVTHASDGNAGELQAIAGTLNQIDVSGGSGPLATVSLADTAVMPGTYTNASITVTAQGQITSASSVSAAYDKSYAEVQTVISVPGETSVTIMPYTVVGTPSPNFNATTGIYTVPATGWYSISASVTWGTSSEVPGSLEMVVSFGPNTNEYQITSSIIYTTSTLSQAASFDYYATTGDTIYIQVSAVTDETVVAGFLGVVQLA